MIELEVNGRRKAIDPGTPHELRDLVTRELPSGHVIRRIDINGDQIDEAQLERVELSRLRSVAVRSCTAAEIARESLSETSEWIDRICGVLTSIGSDFRLGRERAGTARLVDVIDALQVLVGLLNGINGFLEVEPARKPGFEETWAAAEQQLFGSIEGLLEELQSGDPVLLADRTGHTLPRALERFGEILRQARA